MRYLIVMGLVAACNVPITQFTPSDGASSDGIDGPVDAPSGPGLQLLAGGLGGPGSIDGLGTNSRFFGPIGLAIDSGRMFVADDYNNLIRAIDIATGDVTTLAGAGVQGSVDGVGSAAYFYRPYGVASDGAGSLYVTDSLNCTVRKIVIATGEVSTLAGLASACSNADGVGSTARFGGPAGITSDGTNLYVVDAGNNTIRKIVIATGDVSTLAGTAGMTGSTDATGSAALFNTPRGVAFDGAGNLYVADRDNQTIRKIVIATAAVSTFAGAVGSPGSADGAGTAATFNSPIDVAYDGAGNLFVVDNLGVLIREIALSTKAVTTLAGTPGVVGTTDGTGAAARFNAPIGIVADGQGNVYVGDTGNNTVRKLVIASRAATTFAGKALHGGSSDGTGDTASFSLSVFQFSGVAADSTGNLFVADTGNDTVRKVEIETGVVTTIAGTAGVAGSTDGTAAARFNGPAGIAVDGAGNLFVADYFNHTVRMIAVGTGAVSTIAGTAGVPGTADGVGSAARFNFPGGVALDGAGNLFVSDRSNDTIRQIVIATGEVSTLAGSAGVDGSTDAAGSAARFFRPDSIAADGNGSLYVADEVNKTVRKIVIATGEVSTIAGSPGVDGSSDGIASARFHVLTGIAFDGAGNLFVADRDSHTIRRVEIATGMVTTVVGAAGRSGVQLGPLPGGLNAPEDVAAFGGDVFIVDVQENSVLRARSP